jgi:hypothetical protein
VIEETALPNWIRGISAPNYSAENALQCADPISENEVLRERGEKVEMVRKNYISTHGDSKIVIGSFGELNECRVELIVRKQRPPPVRATCDEIKWIAIVDPIQSAWWSGELTHELLIASLDSVVEVAL